MGSLIRISFRSDSCIRIDAGDEWLETDIYDWYGQSENKLELVHQIATLARRFEDLGDRGDAAARREAVLQELSTLGYQAGEKLFGTNWPSVSERLSPSSGSDIKVDSDLAEWTPWIPWEVLYCGDPADAAMSSFCGYERNIYRVLPGASRTSQLRISKAGLVGYSGVDYVRYEDESLQKSLEASPAVESYRRYQSLNMGNRNGEISHLIEWLRELDLIHIAGLIVPVQYPNPGRSWLLLDDNFWMSDRDFVSPPPRCNPLRFSGNPLVILNVCDNYARDPQHIADYVKLLLRSRAIGVIASELPTPSALGEHFTLLFYKHLLDGNHGIGEALAATKASLLKAGNPFVLFYAPFLDPYAEIETADGAPPIPPAPGIGPAGTRVRAWPELPQGVHHDIIETLSAVSDRDRFFANVPEHKEMLSAILSRPQEESAYVHVAGLWTSLWTQRPGLPPFRMVELLSQREAAQYGSYRDHVVHSVLVYLLGLHCYYSSERIRVAMSPIGEPSDFLEAWKVAALFHDMGYYLNFKDRHAQEESERFVLNALKNFVTYPLAAYAKVSEAVQLDEGDERRVRQRAGSHPTWECEATRDLRMPFGTGYQHTLDELDDFVAGANLGSHHDRRYCCGYDKFAEDTDTLTHERCFDHGMISAMMLLKLHRYYELYTEATCKPEYLNDLFSTGDGGLARLLELPGQVKGYGAAVRQAAAAVALHNVQVTGWSEDALAKSKSETYHLTLSRYKLSLEKTPLAWLLALTDAFQCWDRPRRVEPALELDEITATHEEVSVYPSRNEKIAVAFLKDGNRKGTDSLFNKTIRGLRHYMQDLDVLEEG